MAEGRQHLFSQQKIWTSNACNLNTSNYRKVILNCWQIQVWRQTFLWQSPRKSKARPPVQKKKQSSLPPQQLKNHLYQITPPFPVKGKRRRRKEKETLTRRLIVSCAVVRNREEEKNNGPDSREMLIRNVSMSSRLLRQKRFEMYKGFFIILFYHPPSKRCE